MFIFCHYCFFCTNETNDSSALWCWEAKAWWWLLASFSWLLGVDESEPRGRKENSSMIRRETLVLLRLEAPIHCMDGGYIRCLSTRFFLRLLRLLQATGFSRIRFLGLQLTSWLSQESSLIFAIHTIPYDLNLHTVTLRNCSSLNFLQCFIGN